jgi:acetyl esterase/lipase
MTSRIFLSFVCSFGCLLCGPAKAGEEPSYNRQENLVFALEDGVGLVLDVFSPKENANGLGLVLVLSGGWNSGPAVLKAFMDANTFNIYCSRGFTVFMVRTGSRGRYTGEEMVHNLKTGIRWVKEHAGEYKVDPLRLGITGASAGGHLTLMSLVTAEPANPSAEETLDRQSTDVKAAAVFFPPTDFVEWGGKSGGYKSLGDLLFKCGLEGVPEDQARAKAEALSPSGLVKGPLPPLLLIHGDADTVVPLSHSEKMVEAVKKAGGQVELIVKPGGGHPWPTISEETAQMADWLLAKLKE